MMVGTHWKTNRERTCFFNASMDALEKHWLPTNPYPVILQKESWTREEINIISEKWPNLTLQLVEMGAAFDIEPPPSQENVTLAARGQSWSVGYKRMCRFKTFGFLEAPYLDPYDYIMFLDDDSCFLKPVGMDVFREMREHGAVYGFKQIFRDAPEVVEGMPDFERHYMQNRSYANPVLQQQVEQSLSAKLFAFSTNLEWIDTRAYRDPELLAFFRHLDESGMIFHRRWGDAPLRFLLSYMFYNTTQVMKVCVEYVHSNWRVSSSTCNGTLVNEPVLGVINGTCRLYCD